MPDVYATIADADVATQERLAGILELRASDGQQRAMLDSYLSEIDFPARARVLEIGCGTEAVTRVLADWPNVSEAVGIDPSPVFISKARELAAAASAAFELGDGRSLRFANGDFDAVVMHTTLCHIPQPERVLAEAYRVPAPGRHPHHLRWGLRHDHGRPRRVRPASGLHRGGEDCVHQ